jgi:peroxiredoxin
MTMDSLQVPASRPAGLGAGRLRTIAVLAVVVTVVVAAAWYVNQSAGPSTITTESRQESGPLAAGSDAPDFTGIATDGSAVSLAALAGRPVWLTFGASWCPDCRAEAPDIEAAYVRHAPQGLAVIGIFDEAESAAADYAKRAGITVPIVADPQGQIGALYRTYAYPVHFFVGRDGTIKDVRIGRLTPADMEQLVTQLING